MFCSRKVVKAFDISDCVAFVNELLQIDSQGLGVTGNIDDLIHAVADNLVYCLGIHTNPRWVNHDYIRFFFSFFQHFKDVASDEIAIFQTIQPRIFFRGLYGLFHKLDAQYLSLIHISTVPKRPHPS